MAAERTAVPFASVSVLGLGVMGGSLVRALADLPHPPERVGWSPNGAEARAALVEGSLTSAPPTPEDAVATADLVVLAAPLQACVELVPRVLEAMAPGAILSDVASLKAPVELAVHRCGARDRWVGSHPMCGSEASGFSASRADLFQGAPVWLVASENAKAPTQRLSQLWTALGALPAVTTSAQHDALMALTSHLPQLAATALASVLEEARVPASALGPGGQDMTRLAASSPTMWEDLFLHASPALAEALNLLADRCREMAALAGKRDAAALAALLAKTRTWKHTP